MSASHIPMILTLFTALTSNISLMCPIMVIYMDYTTFKIPKRDGNFRTINAPDAELKELIYSIMDTCPLFKCRASRFAHGFTKNRSIVTCMSPHIRKKYLLKFDIKDCFSSIGFTDINSMCMRHKGIMNRLGVDTKCCVECIGLISQEMLNRINGLSFDFDNKVHNISMSAGQYVRIMGNVCPSIFMLTVDKTTNKLVNDSSLVNYLVLPQGAPSSPHLCNLFMRKFDRFVAKGIFKMDVDYTRYADELIFSSDSDKIRNLFKIVPSMLATACGKNVVINEDKTVFFENVPGKRVFGLVVDKEVRLSKRERHNLRAIRYQIENGRPIDNVLRGELAFAHMVEEGSKINPLEYSSVQYYRSVELSKLI